MKREQVLRNARFAGEVRRYHTWSVHRQQSVAEHSWQCMRIYAELWGDLPKEVAVYFLWHDAGELVLGDLPFPVKANNPALKRECDLIERNAVIAMGGNPQELPEPLKTRSKLADLLDMYQYGLCERSMGNRYAQPIVDDIKLSIEQLARKLPFEEQNLVDKYVVRSTEQL